MNKRGFYHNTILIIALYLVSSAAIFAQPEKVEPAASPFYFKASGGYGIGINGEYFISSINGNVSATTSKMGNGLYPNVAVGYRFNPNLAIELGIGSERGFSNDEYKPVDGNSAKFNGNMGQLVPTLVFSNQYGRFTPYIRTGILANMPEIYFDQVNTFINAQNQSSVRDVKVKIHDGFSTGLQTALGCSMAFNNPRWEIFAEACFNEIAYLPQKASIYSETINGADVLSTLNTSQKEEVYKKSYSVSQTNQPSDQPTIVPQVKVPFSAVVFNLGIRYSLAKEIGPGPDVSDDPHYYLRFNAGYGFASNGDIIYKLNNGNANAINVSYGDGLNLNLGAGYMFNENLGLDLGLNFVSSNTLKSDGGGTLTQGQLNFTDETSQHGDMFCVNPSVVFATHIKTVEVYTRAGLLVGFGQVFMNFEDPHALYNGNYYDEKYQWEYYGGISFGYNATIGASYPINDNLNLFAELTANNIYFIPQRAQLIKDDYNGTNFLDYLSTSQKSVVFKSSYDNNAAVNFDEPSNNPSQKFSFNAIVASIGVRLTL